MRLIVSAASLAGLAFSCADPVYAQETTTYSYDAKGRVVSVSRSGGPSGGANTAYTYDPADNRTNVTVTNSSNGSGGGASTGASIDTQLAFAATSVSVNEGSPLVFTVARQGSTSQAVSVSYATANGTAVAGANYTASVGTLIIGAGAVSGTISVATIHDGVYTPNLAMSIALSSPSPGVILGTSSATGTVVNTDPGPPSSISISSATANAGSPLTFQLTRTGNTSIAESVQYATANGTAVAGTNYTATSGTATVAAGATSATISVPTTSGSGSSTLTMALNLSSPSQGGVLGTSSATGSIVPQQQITATNPTLPTYAQSTTGNTIAISALATMNTGSAKVASFNLSSGGGSASISSDGQTVTYSAPAVGSACNVAPTANYTATYTVAGVGTSASASGTAHITVKGSVTSGKSCLN